MENKVSLKEPQIDKLKPEVRLEKEKLHQPEDISEQDVLQLSLQLICEKLPQNLGEEVCTYLGKGEVEYNALFEKKKEEEEKCYTLDVNKEEEQENLRRFNDEKRVTKPKKKEIKLPADQGGIASFLISK